MRSSTVFTKAKKMIVARIFRVPAGHPFAQRFCRNIRVRLVSLIAHRLEDYIETTRRLSSENLIDVQVIVDRIREIFEGGDEFESPHDTNLR